MRAIHISPILALVAACSSGTYLHVTVHSGTPLTLTHLVVEITAPDQRRASVRFDPDDQFTIPPSQSFVLRFPERMTGKMRLDLALYDGSTQVARSMVEVVVVADEATRVEVLLAPGTLDMAPPDVLALPDASAPPDISAPPDLTIDSVDASIPIPRTGLQAEYLFEGSATDTSGNNHHGAIKGGVMAAADRFGRAGAAYRFNGSDGFIDTGAWNISTGLTISAWIRVDSKPGLTSIVSKYDGNVTGSDQYIDRTFELFIDHMQRFRFTANESNETGVNIGGGPEVQLGRWHHLAASFDATQQTASLFLDGSLIERKSTPFTSLKQSGVPLLIGAVVADLTAPGSYTTTSYAMATIDDVRIYGRALSVEEIDVLLHERGWTAN